ncbi:multidrug effflux MFS transporter [Solimonas marina]|nr:multidrug effflux MFS transporter [Solimonas marina]
MRLWVMSVGLIVAIGPFSIDMYLPSLPALQTHFGVDAAAVQRTLSLFFVGLAIGQLIYGPIADRFGRRGPLLSGLILYTLTSVACRYAPNIETLAMLRFLQALGGAAGMVVVRAMVRDRFSGPEMARVLSSMTAVMGVAPIIAPTLGGFVFRTFGWQGEFAFLAIFGTLCIIIAARMLPETLAQRVPHTPRSVAAHYLQMMRHRRFMGYALAGGTAQGAMFAYISVSAFVFIDYYRLTPVAFAIMFGCNAGALIVASQLNALVLRRVPVQVVLRYAVRTSAAASGLTLIAAATGIGGLYTVLPPLFVAIGSLGFSFPNATAAAMAPFGDRAGIAAALLGTLQFTIAAVSGSVAAALYSGTPLAMAAVMAVCGVVAVLLLRTLAPAEPAAA